MELKNNTHEGHEIRPSNHDFNQVQNKPSYLVGMSAGAAAGAVAMVAYTKINPLWFGTFAELAVMYMMESHKTEELPNNTTLLVAGAIVGAGAGAVRTAVDRRFGQNNNGTTLKDIGAGIVAAPLPILTKCMLFPVFEVWKVLPIIFQTLTCSAVGGMSAVALTPVSIAASIAARIANQK